MSTETLNYAVILKISDVDVFVKQVEDLKNQKYPPSSYFVVALTKPNAEELNQIGAALNKTSKVWTIKANLDNYSFEFLIDEFFSAKNIKNKTCLAIDTNVALDLSERIKDLSLANKDCWLFKIDGHQYFYSVLCEYFTFENIEKGIIESGHVDKIYGETLEHSTT